MNKVLDGIDVSEFDELLDNFIDAEDPNMMSFEAFDEAVNLQLDEMAALEVELTGTIRDGQIIFDTPIDAPILVHNNKIVIGGYHLVINLHPELVPA